MTSKTIIIALGLALGVMGICSGQSVNQSATAVSDSTRNKAVIAAITARLQAAHAAKQNAPQVAISDGNAVAPKKNQVSTAVAVNGSASGSASGSRRAAYLAEVRSQAAAKHLQDSITTVSKSVAINNKSSQNTPLAVPANAPLKKIIAKKIGGGPATPAGAGNKPVVNPASN